MVLAQDSQAAISGGENGPYILSVTASEVVVDVIAHDRKKHPVNDLQASDFQVFEIGRHGAKTQRRISAFRVIAAAPEILPASVTSGGFQVNSGGGCAIAATLHYQLAYQPSRDGWTSGFHELLVTTTRPHVTLLFHNQYFVGETQMPLKPRIHPGGNANAALQQAACLHGDTPPSIGLSSLLMPSSSPDNLRYAVIVKPNSLTMASIRAHNLRAQLDYGACTFDAMGMPLNFIETSSNRTLTSEEYARLRTVGLPSIISLPSKEDPAFVRFVVRDRMTGNIGLIEVSTYLPVRARNTASELGSFGTIIPKRDSMCGDVYELKEGTSTLPNDFWDRSPVGTIYASSLNLPYQVLSNGLPGITNRSEWFAIDYYGNFWVNTPGKYYFRMNADDGARLLIDDSLVVNEDGLHPPVEDGSPIMLSAGEHTIHLPYFQGPDRVALILQIKAPGEKHFRLFDLHNFAEPGNPTSQAAMKPTQR